ncbi:2-C-methyl-D-erythritol 2,4-cyclodiphosphate synthase [Mucilaginibacter rubeus]|uniref:2-C-methyl-D-erythritol 2,4-cyclodiphosphate synthase n=1 Tax=Mucilaginibacter rubeus TaxID=2027860 RepID=A0AAE6MJC8_9SPHI|nr:MULTISPECIES: 2-C-methyl-D-erythritol 2,4-cyclodiphosphate synthase [Mucilaginibacter]QEM05451.1 2-C-methyl-D-erythritol 2,4-cyclodiphosphate synthase [Mucilaginibacter rubeus]QEM18036.1 2-C-methyl-D-erythritol 2,4-cyclodiphosphate synthase [Mucilaginibacter gossypii]QTE45427.1 2-C-methyl-D-erythritol 2,4-cyclodiphosphate synthase [Mucilaginibacter rubeus]QTE52024.1 2-C-methyl-D-erythritol 2,4-cyclodiphosphate synthase [Mucilaginibacter rubeus]QTE57113.1 2-C-methyl-D-erythritol 2,4-cyclodip
MGKIKVGFGFDVHQLKKDHPFVLGGVKLEHHAGAYGHSDADVLLHAICDALLGAANLRDIGFHFSNKDDRWKGISSLVLLQHVVALIKEKGFTIGNIDAMVCLEAPKINPHIPEMKTYIAEAAAINEEDISIKATTNEQMGFIGREEGVVAYAVCLIERG